MNPLMRRIRTVPRRVKKIQKMSSNHIVVPGDTILMEPGSLMGKGILQDSSGSFYASTCGVVEKINKLMFVRALKKKYSGEIGDVIVGRITEIAGDRWIVDFGGTQMATLPLGGINLPGSVQRRRTDEDQMQMRDYFREGDVFACEIQKVMESGEVMVHCRSNKYGILRNGQLVQVEASLVKRQSTHFLNITTRSGDQVQLVLGNNGWIWVGVPSRQIGHIQSLNFTQVDDKSETVDSQFRIRIIKIRNCIVALANARLQVTVESLTALLMELEQSVDQMHVTDDMIKRAHDSIV